jgi:hypothetical protein
MHRLDEDGSSSGGAGEPTREALERRIRELEQENRTLKADLRQARDAWRMDRQELEAYYSIGFPVTEEELLNRIKSGPTLREVLDELKREYGV